MSEVIHFYQTGTFTVGNRLVDAEDRSLQAQMNRTNSLNSGHRACQGCGEALGARYAVDAAMRATNNNLAAANATGCLEVFSTPYPETSWQLPWFHSLFGNTAAVATGMAAAFRARAKREGREPTRVIAQGGGGSFMGLIHDNQIPVQREHGIIFIKFSANGGGTTQILNRCKIDELLTAVQQIFDGSPVAFGAIGVIFRIIEDLLSSYQPSSTTGRCVTIMVLEKPDFLTT